MSSPKDPKKTSRTGSVQANPPASDVRRGSTGTGSPLPKDPKAKAAIRQAGINRLGISEGKPVPRANKRSASVASAPVTSKVIHSQPNKSAPNGLPSLSRTSTPAKQTRGGQVDDLASQLFTPSPPNKFKPRQHPNIKPHPSTPPPKGKRTYAGRNLTDSDEGRNIQAQPPTKRVNVKYPNPFLVGNISSNLHVQVVANVDDNKKLILTTRDDEPVEISEVKFVTEVDQYIKKDETRKEARILKYVAQKAKTQNKTVISISTPNHARNIQNLQIDSHRPLLGSTMNGDLESPMLASPKPILDVRVGYHKIHGEGVYVYAYIHRTKGTVAFRAHENDLPNFKPSVKEKLAALKMKVAEEDIVFTDAYSGNDIERVKADVYAILRLRDTSKAPDTKVEGNMLGASDPQEKELSLFLEETPRWQQIPRIEVEEAGRDPGKSDSDLDDREHRLRQKEEALARRERAMFKKYEQQIDSPLTKAMAKDLSAIAPKKSARKVSVTDAGTSSLEPVRTSNSKLEELQIKYDKLERLATNVIEAFGQFAKLGEDFKEELSKLKSGL